MPFFIRRPVEVSGYISGNPPAKAPAWEVAPMQYSTHAGAATEAEALTSQTHQEWHVVQAANADEAADATDADYRLRGSQ